MCQCLQLVQLVKMTKNKHKNKPFTNSYVNLIPGNWKVFWGFSSHKFRAFSVQMTPPSLCIRIHTVLPFAKVTSGSTALHRDETVHPLIFAVKMTSFVFYTCWYLHNF